MTVPIVQVDAFTDRAFAGNPAAVCVLDAARDEAWMQNVAREMNLAETAFLVPRGGEWNLRWFTPAIEVDLCGHATLASAHVLWEEGHLDKGSTAVFHTASGRLTADREEGGIRLDFPSEPPRETPVPTELPAALGELVVYLGRSRTNYLVELESEDAVRNLRPDLAVIERLDAQGLIVTAAASTEPFDFVSRYFAPAAGIDEDPVTGSAHCCLGPYWQQRLGRSTFQAYQASARGGKLEVRVVGDRVHLIGRAITVLRGELLA
jgi:PhzF family phenazine biosynthesis protein